MPTRNPLKLLAISTANMATPYTIDAIQFFIHDPDAKFADEFDSMLRVKAPAADPDTGGRAASSAHTPLRPDQRAPPHCLIGSPSEFRVEHG